MYRRVLLLALVAVLVGLALASPTQAAGASCWSDPVSGPPGTSFYIYCAGFSANTHLNTYVVEPDGRAVSGGQVTGFASNLGNGDILTDAYGEANFVWHSQDGGQALQFGGSFSHQLGAWTWVVHELGSNQSVVAQGKTTVVVQANAYDTSGAALDVTTNDHQTFWVYGSGFWRDEIVNVWVTLPAACSGRANVEAAGADDPAIQGLYDGFSGPSNVKADEEGNIVFPLEFSSRACLGWYSVTARALGSGYGAIADFEVKGDAVTETLDRWIQVTPDSVSALNPWVTVDGGGWDAWEGINCWSTRPDGRTFSLGTVTADGSGYFSWSGHLSNNDSFSPFASEEPGMWYVTCRSPGDGHTALTSLWVMALASDP